MAVEATYIGLERLLSNKLTDQGRKEGEKGCQHKMIGG